MGSKAVLCTISFGRSGPGWTSFLWVLLQTFSLLLLPLASIHLGFRVLGLLGLSWMPICLHPCPTHSLLAWTPLLDSHLFEALSGLKQLHCLVLICRLDLPNISAHSYLLQPILASGSHSRTPLLGWSVLPALSSWAAPLAACQLTSSPGSSAHLLWHLTYRVCFRDKNVVMSHRSTWYLCTTTEAQIIFFQVNLFSWLYPP